MAYTTSFKTISEIVPCVNLAAKGIFPIALDIGYSAVKGFSPSVRFCFPAFVREHIGEIIGNPKKSDILYKDETGIYAVGALATDSISSKDTNDASNTMFGRNRYYSPAFLVLARVGMAIAMKRNNNGGCAKDDTVFLQTGLPPAYRKVDTPLLVDALSGRHAFSIRIGSGKWADFDFELHSECISVIDQPIGSVYSASKKSNGKTVMASNGKTYIDSRTLVLDGGFGTLDIFSIINRKIDNSNTFNDLGMKAIFEKTSADIFRAYGKEIYAHTMQSCLETGLVTVYDRKNRSTREYDISGLLEKSNEDICNRALNKIESAYDLEDYDYLIVTGGTGAAWMPYIKARYEKMSTLEILCANQNEPISPVYNNVRGYYIYRALAGKR